MSKEKEYHELYDRLMAEVAALHQSNRRRIRSGMRMLVVVTVGLMLLMFLAEGNKVFTLMLWIAAMFGVASYLIAVEYADYELQKKLEQITQMEQESLGALLELPELPSLPHVGRLPGLLRHGGEQEGRRAGGARDICPGGKGGVHRGEDPAGDDPRRGGADTGVRPGAGAAAAGPG